MENLVLVGTLVCLLGGETLGATNDLRGLVEELKTKGTMGDRLANHAKELTNTIKQTDAIRQSVGLKPFEIPPVLQALQQGGKAPNPPPGSGNVPGVENLQKPIIGLPNPGLLKPSGSILKPTTELLKPPVELLKPPVELLKPPVELLKPPVELLKPPVELLKPPVELLKPPVELLKPPVELFKPTGEISKPVLEQIKPNLPLPQPPSLPSKENLLVLKPEPLAPSAPSTSELKPIVIKNKEGNNKKKNGHKKNKKPNKANKNSNKSPNLNAPQDEKPTKSHIPKIPVKLVPDAKVIPNNPPAPVKKPPPAVPENQFPQFPKPAKKKPTKFEPDDDSDEEQIKPMNLAFLKPAIPVPVMLKPEKYFEY